MTSQTYDVLGIGNALVDVISPAEDSFISSQGPDARHDDFDRYRPG